MRREEIRILLNLSVAEVREKAGEHLVLLPDTHALHRHFADSIADEIIANNRASRPTKLILPVGPVGQYPLLADRVNDERISLRNCWLFMMDEHCDEQGNAVGSDHPLGFRRHFDEVFLRRLNKDLTVPDTQLVFPDERNVEALEEKIAALGGIGTAYGGVGIHGHVAYNEPEPGVRDTGPRRVNLNEFTRTINAIRSKVGGNLENYPRQGYTLGMRQILGAKRIRLYCRNGIHLDWANTVLRLALLGEPGDDYPVTHIRDHPGYLIVTDEDTIRQPQIIV